ncbi:hypothetical protein ACJIZ3_011465 [Penstemon smallii]|uniref:Transposase Tnp1/En/Spm-like domain-containing protein n=1 Tax=Penstemon smallii TaxID=265156 RepID=A0ABD3UMG2_9LAMI
MEGLLRDAFGMPDLDNEIEDDATMDNSSENTKSFCKLIDDSQQPLFPGCEKYTKLSFLVHLLNIKCLGSMSDRTFTRILDLLRDAFPSGVQLPKSYYDTKKFIKEMGFSYEKYDACKNDCMLYWGLNKGKEQCDICKAPRWITPVTEASHEIGNSCNNNAHENRKKEHKVAAKVGARVSIRSLFDSSRIVATGRVYGLDPSLKVGSQLLGPNWCEVHIQVAIECGEKLPRPYALFKTVKHAEGATIAWPCHLVMVEEDFS